MTPQTPATVMGRRSTPVMEEPMGIHPRTRTRRAISVPPWTVLGYRADGRPIRPLAGGADDDPDVEIDDPEPEAEPEDPEPADDPEPEPEPEAADKPKPKPPAKKSDPKPGDDDYVPSPAEWRRTQEALKKANLDAKRNRERARELEEQGRTNETEHEKALRLAREEGEKKFRAPLVRTAARSALIEAGALAFLQEEPDPDSKASREKGDSRLARMLKLLDTDSLDIDESGDVLGLEGAVDDLRRDYPELFAAPVKKVKARPTAAPRPAADPVKKSAAQQHADKILGRA